MKNLVVFAQYNHSTYAIPLLLAITKMDKNIKCFYVGEPLEKEYYQNYYDILKKNGVLFISENEYSQNKNDIFLVDGVKRHYIEMREKVGDALFIIYQHSNDNIRIYNNTCHIVTDYYQFNILLKANNISPKNTNFIKIDEFNTEIFIGGYYHYFEMIPLLKLPKTVLRTKLEDKLQIKFNPELPLLVYNTGERLRERKIKETLEYLSEYYNIIVKATRATPVPLLKEKENLFICTKRREPLIKFACDIHLVPVASGAILSNFAFGIKTIPIYSYEMGENLSANHAELMFEKYFRSYNLLHYCRVFPFMQDYFNLVPPVSMYDYKRLKNIIDNQTFWKNFEEKVIVEKEKLFGKIIVEDSIQNTVKYILQILSRP